MDIRSANCTSGNKKLFRFPLIIKGMFSEWDRTSSNIKTRELRMGALCIAETEKRCEEHMKRLFSSASTILALLVPLAAFWNFLHAHIWLKLLYEVFVLSILKWKEAASNSRINLKISHYLVMHNSLRLKVLAPFSIMWCVRLFTPSLYGNIFLSTNWSLKLGITFT